MREKFDYEPLSQAKLLESEEANANLAKMGWYAASLLWVSQAK